MTPSSPDDGRPPTAPSVEGDRGAAFDRVVDPGVQNERTSLAWSRALLSLAAVGVLVGKAWWATMPAVAIGWVAVVAVGCETLRRVSRHRYRDVHDRLVAGLPLLPGRSLPSLVTATTLVGAAALVACLR